MMFRNQKDSWSFEVRACGLFIFDVVKPLGSEYRGNTNSPGKEFSLIDIVRPFSFFFFRPGIFVKRYSPDTPSSQELQKCLRLSFFLIPNTAAK